MEYDNRVNIVNFYLKAMKDGENYCGRSCKANLSYGESRCVGRISPSILRPVLSLENGTFIINSEKDPIDAVSDIPPDCPFFK